VFYLQKNRNLESLLLKGNPIIQKTDLNNLKVIIKQMLPLVTKLDNQPIEEP
jgi:hypothetical protein